MNRGRHHFSDELSNRKPSTVRLRDAAFAVFQQPPAGCLGLPHNVGGGQVSL
jgi:hypothetical protein